jgi:hypothetical protein
LLLPSFYCGSSHALIQYFLGFTCAHRFYQNKTELPPFDALIVVGTSGVLGGAMFKIITMQFVAAAVAAVLAGTTVLLTSVAPPARAMPHPDLSNEIIAKPVQLAPALTVTACSSRSWPYYDQACLRSSTGDLRKVRVINLETRILQARAD